ncbi:MAG: hypothetical protein ACREVA_12745 [Burkholderiales bacterium]
MHHSDITRIAEQSKAKAAYLDHMPAGYLILSALAGIYLGFAITLIFSGADDLEWQILALYRTNQVSGRLVAGEPPTGGGTIPGGQANRL